MSEKETKKEKLEKDLGKCYPYHPMLNKKELYLCIEAALDEWKYHTNEVTANNLGTPEHLKAEMQKGLVWYELAYYLSRVMEGEPERKPIAVGSMVTDLRDGH